MMLLHLLYGHNEGEELETKWQCAVGADRSPSCRSEWRAKQGSLICGKDAEAQRK